MIECPCTLKVTLNQLVLVLLDAMAKMEQWLNLHNQLPNPNMEETQSELKGG